MMTFFKSQVDQGLVVNQPTENFETWLKIEMSKAADAISVQRSSVAPTKYCRVVKEASTPERRAYLIQYLKE